MFDHASVLPQRCHEENGVWGTMGLVQQFCTEKCFLQESLNIISTQKCSLVGSARTSHTHPVGSPSPRRGRGSTRELLDAFTL